MDAAVPWRVTMIRGAVYVAPALWNAVKRRALVEGCTLRNLTTRALQEYLERHKRDPLAADYPEWLLELAAEVQQRSASLFAANPAPTTSHALRRKRTKYARCANPACGHLLRSHVPNCFYQHCRCPAFVDPYDAETHTIAALQQPPVTQEP